MKKEISLVTTLDIEASKIDLNEMLEHYTSSLDRMKETKKDYMKGIRNFIKWKSEYAPEDSVTNELLLKWKEYNIQNYKPRTVNNYLSGIKSLFDYLEQFNIPNIASGIKQLKITNEHTKIPLVLQQVFQVEEVFIKRKTEAMTLYKQNKIKKRKLIQAYRDHALFIISLYNSLREVEISEIDKTDIFQKLNKFVAKVRRKGKQSKGSTIVLYEYTYNTICEYLNIREKDSYNPLFISLSGNSYGNRITTRSIRQIITDAFLEVGIDTPLITTHSLRHTGATELYNSGEDILKIKELLEHSNLNTSLIYVHEVDRINNSSEEILGRHIDSERKLYYGN